MKKLTRREFAVGCAAFATLRGWSGEDSGIRQYYHEYLRGIRKRVAAAAKGAAQSFWFVTDMHIPSNAKQSGCLLADLVRTTSVSRVVSGGDLCEAFGGKPSVDQTIAEWRDLWVRPIEAAGGELLVAKGNHDFTIKTSPQVDDGFTCDGREARQILMDTVACHRVVTNEMDPEACYYYADDARAKVRTIVADTTDSIDPSKKFWAVRYGVGETQLRWLAEKAFSGIPDGWSLVVVHHIPISRVVGNEELDATFAPLRDLIEAYQNRERVVLFGRTYDFSYAKGRILLDLTGHCHTERSIYRRGILHVTQPCDAAYEDYKFASLGGGGLPTKERGTVYEQTFDCVHLDPEHDQVRFTRFGGGSDRIYRLKPLRLLPGKKSDDRYDGIVDCDFAAVRHHPTRKYTELYDFRSTYSKIVDGRILALKPGVSLAWRNRADGVREYVPVEVYGK